MKDFNALIHIINYEVYPMIRTLLVCLVFVLAFGASLASAKSKMSSNPNDPALERVGNKMNRVDWKSITTGCKPCQHLVDRYNLAMQEVFYYRQEQGIWINYQANFERGAAQELKLKNRKLDITDDKTLGGATASKALGDMFESDAKMQKALKVLKALEKKASQIANQLYKQIKDCEKQCKGGKQELSGITIGTLPPIMGVYLIGVPPLKDYKLSFKWDGPYPVVCPKYCEKLAARLNELPELYRTQMFDLDIEKRKDSASQVNLKIGGGRASVIEANLKKIKENFKATLKLYNDCIKKCKPKKQACVFPEDSGTSITVGPNSKVGTGAKLKSKAKGMAMGALGRAFGGSGFSFGGGGKKGGRGSEQPKTEKDPTSGDFVNVSSGGGELGVRAGFTDDGLVISSLLDDIPGKGTFHAQWLEDGKGHRILPKRYLIFSLYQDWKLTVSWTHDKWVDGEHVYHDEGKEISFGRNDLGSYAVWFEEEKNAIWNRLGFGTAVKGVDQLGTIYDVAPSALKGPCPLRLVTHVSKPKDKPNVGTIPFMHDLFRSKDESADKNNLIVMVRPSIVSGNDVE